MKLWCLFVVFLIITISTSLVCSNDWNNNSNQPNNIEENPSVFQSSSYTRQDRSIVKRSQRNANILYRYCRQFGQAPQFCLKYAIRMILATGH